MIDLSAKLAAIDRALSDHDRQQQDDRQRKEAPPILLVGSALTTGAALFAAGFAFMWFLGMP